MDMEAINYRIESEDFVGPLPEMYSVFQKFESARLTDIEVRIESQFAASKKLSEKLSGKRIAVTVGSRGIAELPRIVRSVVRCLQDNGAEVIIVPSMGSHGGATAAGQREVLESYGIVEAVVGAEIVSDMEVLQVGLTKSGMPVYCDRVMAESDGIVVMNKIKPHADFKGDHESGLVKMMAIGMGKHRGAVTVHKQGFAAIAKLLPEFAEVLLRKTPILWGIAILENHHDEIFDVELILPEDIIVREKALLKTAKAMVPRLPFPKIDVLIVEEIGKNISGEGMDPNVTGRPGSGLTEGFIAPVIDKIVVLKVTPESHGNGVGIGMADISTMTCLKSLDLGPMYTNVLTTGSLAPAKLPLLGKNDEEAIRLAVASANGTTWKDCKIVWIKNTLEVEEMYVSKSLADVIQENAGINISRDRFSFHFGESGNFLGFKKNG